MIISQKRSNLDYAQFHINFMDNSVTVETLYCYCAY